MSESRVAHDDPSRAEAPIEGLDATDVSMLDLVSLVLRHRWKFVRWMLVCGLLVAVPVYLREREYTSSASFVLQGTDQGRAGLNGLAGQLGLQLSAGGSLSQSPQFYADLLKTREILGRVADDRFSRDAASKPVPFVDLFEITGSSGPRRRDAAIRRLSSGIVGVRVSKSTGMIGVDVTTPWPDVSRGIARDLLDGVNRFSLVMRQTQAAAERRFSEERVEASRAALRVTEDRLAEFLKSNRQYQNSPELSFTHERLQREVSLQQQVFTSVVQSYEEARAREARNTPVITVVDSASGPTSPNSRGGLPRFVVGMLLGGMLCLLVVFVRYSLLHQRAAQPEVERFRHALYDVRGDLTPWASRGPKTPEHESADRAGGADG